jgi:FkbH-like protein
MIPVSLNVARSTVSESVRLQQADDVLAALERRHGTLPIAALDSIVEALVDVDREQLTGWLERRAPTPAGLYIQTQLLQDDDVETVAERWERLLVAVGSADASLLLDAARAHARAANPDQAVRRLRHALELRPPYGFHARAAALVNDLWTIRPPAMRSARVALLGSATTSLLVPVLRALCFRDGVSAEFYETTYGAYRQEILERSSGLHRFAPSIAFLATHWRDLPLPPVSTDETAEVERILAECEMLWAALFEAARCHIVQHAFDLPAEESHDYVATAAHGGRIRILQKVNIQMAQRAPAYVSIFDQPSLQREVGLDRWQDDRLWHTARQHPSADALPALAELQMAHIRALTGLAKKVLVCDLDNTLWGGVIGEDGLDGIRIGPDSPEGEAHARLQDYLLELKRRGVLLAVCSKNNPDDARLPFERHPHMRLRLDDFAVFTANWNDKAQNLRTIADQLSLAVDSFVVLDDDPFERAWIRAQLPDATVIEWGSSCFSRVRELDRGRYFFSLSLSEEDRQRSDHCRAEASRQVLKASFASIDEFLEQLQMRSSAVPISSANLPRVTQLLNKTNQFNLTGRRHQQQSIEEFLAKDGNWGAAFRLADRFSDYGLVSVILCELAAPRVWEIDTWVMSCRVLGRGLERYAMQVLLAAARDAGIDRIIGVYRPTPRNIVVSGLFEELGFLKVPSESDSEKQFEGHAELFRSLPAHKIRSSVE